MELAQEIKCQMVDFQQNITKMLNEEFPYLVFYINSDNKISLWVRGKDGYSEAAIEVEKTYCDLGFFNYEYFSGLNQKMKLVSKEPDKYFYCTECGRVLDKEDFAENVFAGYYCKECAKKPEIAKLIEMSHEVGFYD